MKSCSDPHLTEYPELEGTHKDHQSPTPGLASALLPLWLKTLTCRLCVTPRNASCHHGDPGAVQGGHNPGCEDQLVGLKTCRTEV